MYDLLISMTSIAVIFFVGILCIWLAQKSGISEKLLFIIAGILLGTVHIGRHTLISLSLPLLSSLTLLALSILAFDSTAHLRLFDLDTFTTRTLRNASIVLLCTLLVTALVARALNAIPLLFALILASTLASTKLATPSKNRTGAYLYHEHHISCALALLLTALFVLLTNVRNTLIIDILPQLAPPLFSITIGVGTGVFLGIILFKLIQHANETPFAPLAITTSALLAYVLSENLGGSGIFAAATLGFFLANAPSRTQPLITSFENSAAKPLSIFLYVTCGIISTLLPLTPSFITRTLLLFVSMLATRLIFLALTEKRSVHELITTTLYAPIGPTTLVLTLALMSFPGMIYGIPHAPLIVQTALAFIVLSTTLQTLKPHENRTH